jgi:hypothetical protein
MLDFHYEPVLTITPGQELAAVMGVITANSARPRYTFMILELIARVADSRAQAGPYVRQGSELVPIREWLASAIAPTASRHHQRKSTVNTVRRQLTASGKLPADPDVADKLVAEEVSLRVLASGMTAVSRAVSELVRAGLLERHYQGYRVDHHNRGAQRQAVYTVTSTARRALGVT